MSWFDKKFWIDVAAERDAAGDEGLYCPECDEDLASGHDDNCPLMTKRVEGK